MCVVYTTLHTHSSLLCIVFFKLKATKFRVCLKCYHKASAVHTYFETVVHRDNIEK